jgi:hypothetical protein
MDHHVAPADQREPERQVDRMSVIEHEPVEFEVCVQSGEVSWECGLAACDNGCTTRTVQFVPLATYQGAVAENERLREVLGRIADERPGDVEHIAHAKRLARHVLDRPGRQ